MPSFGSYEVFDQIYEESYWGIGSGSGSSLQACRPYINFLTRFLKQKKIKSVVDLGCGDWQFSRYIDFAGLRYTGIDASREIIKKNSEVFGSPQRVFMHFSGDYDAVPAGELLLCKDVLQHLSNDEIFSFINVLLPRFSYALITNDVPKRSSIGNLLDRIRNIDIKSLRGLNRNILIGDYRPVDLTQAPFNLQAKTVLEWRVNPYGIGLILRRPKQALMGDNCGWKKRTILSVQGTVVRKPPSE